MLGTPPPPLAEQVAALAAELRLEAARQGEEAGIIAALRALILISLARIFTSLERMVALWQAGLLPPPAPRRPGATPRPRPHAPAPRLSAPHPRARRQRHPTSPESPITPARAPESAPRARPAPIAAPARVAQRQPHPGFGRAPPGPFRSKPVLTAPPPHAHFVTIS